MKIRSATIENFRGIPSRIVQFHPITLIEGPNKSGKTTIGEAIAFALRGITIDGRERGLVSDRFIRRELNSAARTSPDTASVALELETSQGDVATLTRRRTRKADGTEKMDVLLNGRKISKGALDDLLGALSDTSVFLSVYKAGYFMQLSEPARREVVMALLPPLTEPEEASIRGIVERDGRVSEFLRDHEVPLLKEGWTTLSKLNKKWLSELSGARIQLDAAKAALAAVPESPPIPADISLAEARALLEGVDPDFVPNVCPLCEADLSPTSTRHAGIILARYQARLLGEERGEERKRWRTEIQRLEENEALIAPRIAKASAAMKVIRDVVVEISSLQLSKLQLPRGYELQLFEEKPLENGEIDLLECCRLSVGGLDFSCLADSVGIQAGYAMAKALRRASGMEMPIWVDRLESCHLPLDVEPQTILARVTAPMTSLTVTAVKGTL